MPYVILFLLPQEWLPCPPKLEVPYLLPSSSARPADIYLPLWSSGTPAALDVTVVSPMQQSTLARSAITQGHALKVAADRKMTLHSSHCHQVGIHFLPLPVESLGGWSSLAISTLKDIAFHQATRLDIPPGPCIQHLFQRLSIGLWRGNASMWIDRSDSSSPPMDDGVE